VGRWELFALRYFTPHLFGSPLWVEQITTLMSFVTSAEKTESLGEEAFLLVPFV
jgi:hypothetical protein